MNTSTDTALLKNPVPALAGAGVCLFLLRSGTLPVVFLRSGVLAFFFLAPLSFVSFKYGSSTAWLAFLFTVIGNVFLTAGTAAARGIPLSAVVPDMAFFTGLTAAFTWIHSPRPAFLSSLSVSARFAAGSCVGALVYAGIFWRALTAPGFAEMIESMADALLSMYQSSSDVVQNALLESINAEMIVNMMKSIVLRGGSLVTCVLQFFISREAGLFALRLSLRRAGAERIASLKTHSLAFFHTPPALIWVLSASLFLVVLARTAGLTVPEILLWNILLLCVSLYLAQGFGILQSFLARPSLPPFLKLLICVGFVMFLFTPGLNALLLAGMVLLGIAENWVPFRVPKDKGLPSTPEAGGGA